MILKKNPIWMFNSTRCSHHTATGVSSKNSSINPTWTHHLPVWLFLLAEPTFPFKYKPSRKVCSVQLFQYLSIFFFLYLSSQHAWRNSLPFCLPKFDRKDPASSIFTVTWVLECRSLTFVWRITMVFHRTNGEFNVKKKPPEIYEVFLYVYATLIHI